MSLKAKGLLALCLALPEDWEYSLNGLCAICKESQTSIRSALKELETFRYLRRERSKDSKGQFVYEYIIYEIPYSENQHTDKQHTEKQHTENDIQQKTEKQITKKQNNNSLYIEEFENILAPIGNEGLKGLYREYIDMREGIDAPITPKGLKMLLQRCERLANLDIELQKAMVEAAIINNWKNVYLPNEQDIQNNNTYANLKRTYGG